MLPSFGYFSFALVRKALPLLLVLLGALPRLLAAPPDVALDLLTISGFNCPDTAATASFRIYNVDTDTLFFDQDTLALELEQVGPNSATLNDSIKTGFLAPGDSLLYSFPTLLDLSTPGIYDISVVADLAGDTNSSNDTTQLAVTQNGSLSLPVIEDFESFGLVRRGFWQMAGPEPVLPQTTGPSMNLTPLPMVLGRQKIIRLDSPIPSICSPKYPTAVPEIPCDSLAPA